MSYDVYCWTNTVTKKSYVGYTGQGIIFRWKKHLLNAISGVDTYFYRSIRKYGPEVWSCQHLACSEDQQEAEKLEVFFIDNLKTLAPNGYNSTQGGTGGNTWQGVRVEERKQLISKLTAGSLNPRYSGFTDTNILNAAVELYESNDNVWSATKWIEMCKLNGYPQNMTAFRFPHYGGGRKGFRIALVEELTARGHKDVNLTYSATAEHRAKARVAHQGKVWATNTETGKSKLTDPSLVDGIIIKKGRNIKC